MIIQTTKKLQTLLGTSGIILPSFAEPFSCWHGNILQIKRRKALLLTHNESYYSIFIYGITKKELPLLPKRIQERLKQQLLKDSFTPKEIETILLFSQHFSYFKSSNRKVLGVMNDMAQTIEIHLSFGENDEASLSSRINTTPYKVNGYIYPYRALKEMAREMALIID